MISKVLQCLALWVLAVDALPLGERWGHTAGFTALVVFGDSFSDNGSGAWEITNHTWPALPSYDGGRFSNGIVWPEYLASNLSIKLYDYAVGGATSSNKLIQGFTGPKSSVPVPSVQDQILTFLSSSKSSRPAAESSVLFAVLGGANDVLFNPNITASESAHPLIDGIASLTHAYPNAKVVTLDYPLINHLPASFYVDAATKAKYATFSEDLASIWSGWAKGGNGDYATVDLIPFVEDTTYYASPAKYGYDPLGAYGSCVTGAYGETPNVTQCNDPDKVVFWDAYHPTTHTHSIVAQAVLTVLKQKKWV